MNEASGDVSGQPVVNLSGDLVSLGPFVEGQAEEFQRWHNDYHTMRTWEFLPKPMTVAQAREFHARVAENSSYAMFSVYENTNWRYIGYAGLIDVDHVNRSAELGILLGAPDARGRGFGTEATELVLDHAFLALGLSNVILRVYEYNLAGIKAYEKVGFRTIGRRRKSKMMGGKLWDTIYMEALADEFESPVLGKILVPDQPR